MKRLWITLWLLLLGVGCHAQTTINPANLPHATAGTAVANQGAITLGGGDIAGSWNAAVLAAITTAATQGVFGRLTIDAKGRVTVLSPAVTATITTTATISSADDVYNCTGAGGAFAINLPAASAGIAVYFVEKTDSSANAITITRAGSDTINGATTFGLTVQYEGAMVISDGSSHWYVMSNPGAPSSGSGTVNSGTSGQVAYYAGTGTTVSGENTVTAAQLPNPGASSLGGTQSFAAVSNQFVNQISTSGVVGAAQPAFTNLSGSIAAAQQNSSTASVLGAIELNTGLGGSATAPTLVRYLVVQLGAGLTPSASTSDTVNFVVPYGGSGGATSETWTFTRLDSRAETAPSGGSYTVTVNKNGSSILSSNLAITTGNNSANTETFNTTTCASGDLLQIAYGTVNGAANAAVQLEMTSTF